ncbi:hypothetical protein JQR88_24370 (plasmid) [Pseudomonas luteola]|uniref:hypothetical protein n=1 Tax=Pseudomonas luteola TaxID=47886 RepID=UPI003DA11F7C
MLKQLKFVIALSVSSLMLAGCSGPKDANEANFKKAIQAYYDTRPTSFCFEPDSMDYPVTLQHKDNGRQYEIDQQNVLVQAGYLTRSDLVIDIPDTFGQSGMKNAPVYRYELTPEGSKAFSPRTAPLGKRGFCLGKITVGKVTNFTEPLDVPGMTFSKVQYEYSIQDLPDWATTPAASKGFSMLVYDIKKAHGEAQLVLTNEGWVHKELLRKYTR